MDTNQKINCTVRSCKYHDCNKNICELTQIKVEPCYGGNTGSAKDESMCGSYNCKC